MGFLGPVLAVAAVVLVGHAGGGHLHRTADLRRALDAQALVPRRLRPAAAVALGPVELVAAGLGAVALVTGRSDLAGAAAVLVVALGLAFVTLLLAVRRRRPGAPCGCRGGHDQPVTRASLARAGLVLAGGLALAGRAVTTTPGLDPVATATVVTAGLAIAIVADVATDAQAGVRSSTQGVPQP